MGTETLRRLYGGLALLFWGLWLYVEPLAYLLGRPTPRFSIVLVGISLVFMVLWERQRRGSADSRAPDQLS